MQKTTYICDGCDKEIGLKKHISLATHSGTHTGIAMPPTDAEAKRQNILDELMNECKISDRIHWEVIGAGIRGKFFHFCSAKCMAKFFDERLKEAK